MHKKLYWNFSLADNFDKIDIFSHLENTVVKKVLVSVLLTAGLVSVAHAKTAYISENLELPLRAADNERGKIVKMLPAGSQITVFHDANENGYSYVQASQGVEGFVLSRFLSEQPSSRDQLASASKKLEQLLEENKQLKQSQIATQDVGKQRDKLSTELTELQQTAANAIQLKQQRDELQERVVSIERDLQQLKRENLALTDTSNQDWFLYGGGLALFGVILGFVLPKLSWRRRSSGWDTF